ncbi:MAG: glycosyltransferase family 1 protein [bacterium]
MRVLYDYQAFGAQRAGGVSRYFVELLREWRRSGTVNPELIVPLSVNCHLADARTELGAIGHGLQLPSAWRPGPALALVNRVLFAAATLGRGWDLYHPTYYNDLWPAPRARRRVVTVFDMTHERFPHLFAAHDPTATRKRLAIQAAHGIICISETTRRDLVEITGVAAENTTVIPLATHIGEVRAAPFSHPRPFWLFVGARGGYKKFSVLIEALAGMPALNETDVICFGGGRFTEVEHRLLAAHALTARVRWVAGDDALLRGAYDHALALVYPSCYEGFGLPPLEAMTLGCPVVATNSSSLPEVVGKGGILIPPDQLPALSDALVSLAQNSALRSALVTAGLKQATRFSWKNCAAQTAAYYRRVLAC